MAWGSFWDYFTDPILRAPTLGSMLMCLGASLAGVLVFVRRRSLMGETLSHASYPGVIFAVLIAVALGLAGDEYWMQGIILAGAFIAAVLGYKAVEYLESRWKVADDAALCFVLSAFFGVGLTLASYVQVLCPQEYSLAQSYLYGQAATLADGHIALYGILCFIIIAAIAIFYKEFQVVNFDREFSHSIGIRQTLISTLTYGLVALSVVIGIRGVGVVMMCAMLVAPAAAARQWTNRLSTMFWLTGAMGAVSGFLGNYLSVELSFISGQTHKEVALPTGPTIVLAITAICLVSLFFAPDRGLVTRLGRMVLFRQIRMEENILKILWRCPHSQKETLEEIKQYLATPTCFIRWVLHRLVRGGWVEPLGGGYFALTIDGKVRAAKIVRLHRLWEVYLVDYLGCESERVHRSAEEMEHILTPEIEKELTLLLCDPKKDPHHQPIPPAEPIYDAPSS